MSAKKSGTTRKAQKKSTRKRASAAGGASNLVIVESPAKARAIGKYLGNGFDVLASVGHVRDLPPKELGVDPERGFEPTYVVIRGKKKVLDAIHKAAERAERVYVATDPDREGEAIAWHIVDATGIPLEQVHRATFFEVTPAAVRRAIETPGRIDARKVDSQQARRILDRLVGYRISPLLSDPFYPGLSAGRVQTVALRLVVEREEAIEAFQRVAYWRVGATLEAPAGEPTTFEAELQRVAGQAVVPRGQPGEKGFRPPALTSEEAALGVAERARGATWRVSAVERKERRRTPPPPFTTSTLQQDASRRLGLSARRTMVLAQRLYEGIEIDGEPVGLITYMRTDSTRVSSDALDEVRTLIGEHYGMAYRPERPNVYASRASAQEAHEAIRPTSSARPLEAVRRALQAHDDGRDLYRLYELVWLRFVASQMTPARYDRTTVDFVIDGDLEFRAAGSVLTFPGFLAAYAQAGKPGEAGDDVLLPPLEEGAEIGVGEVTTEGKETQPPARYSEATLVKELEAQGIGRPSTYATIVSRLFERNYAVREGRQIQPTLLGRFVLRYLLHHFDDIFEIGFTREMEEELDKIEEGELGWRKVVEALWSPLDQDVRRLEADGDGDRTAPEWADLEPPLCPKDPAHGPMLLRWNRFGPFWGCREYPACKQTQSIPGLGPKAPEAPCPRCGGELTIRQSRRGPFVGCANYPECDFTMSVGEDPEAVWTTRQAAREREAQLDRLCPRCGEGKLAVKSGRYGSFIGCSRYPKCRFTEPLPTGVTCPQCGEGDLVERRAHGRGARRFYGCSRYPDCDYTQRGAPRNVPCPECSFPIAEVVRSEEGDESLRCPRCKAELSEAEVAPAGEAS
jgi:DNA topoisomerase-1